MFCDLDEWLRTGVRIAYRVPGFEQPFHLFRRVEGSGPCVTFLHGFPTSSWDWAKVTSHLDGKVRSICFDFLGFGESDKPPKHAYDLRGQADFVEAVWAECNVDDVVIVAHDYGVSVVKEILAREAEGTLSTRARIRGVVLLNGLLYEELHRPLLIQRLLLHSLSGPLIARFLGERDFARSFRRVFSTEHAISSEELRQHWSTIERRGGARITDRLIQFLAEHREHGQRWREALHRTSIPCRFLWGLQDPVIGPNMLAELRRNVPHADVVSEESAGHYPQLEIPDRVAAVISNFVARTAR